MQLRGHCGDHFKCLLTSSTAWHSSSKASSDIRAWFDTTEGSQLI